MDWFHNFWVHQLHCEQVIVQSHFREKGLSVPWLLSVSLVPFRPLVHFLARFVILICKCTLTWQLKMVSVLWHCSSQSAGTDSPGSQKRVVPDSADCTSCEINTQASERYAQKGCCTPAITYVHKTWYVCWQIKQQYIQMVMRFWVLQTCHVMWRSLPKPALGVFLLSLE